MVDALYNHIRTYAHAEIKNRFDVEKTFMTEATKAIGSTETGITLVLDKPAPQNKVLPSASNAYLHGKALDSKFTTDIIERLSKAVPRLKKALSGAKITVPSNPERLLVVVQTDDFEGDADTVVKELTRAIAPTWSVMLADTWSYCDETATKKLEQAFNAKEENADFNFEGVQRSVTFDYASQKGTHPKRLDKEKPTPECPNVMRRGKLRVKKHNTVITGASTPIKLPALLKVFELYDIDIGKHPPLFTGVAHYNADVIGEQIILDFDIVWCSTLRGGIRAGFNDWLNTTLSFGNVNFRGTLRVVLSPLVEVFPCFGNFEVSFVTPPDISFDLFVGDVPILGLPFLSCMVDWFIQKEVAKKVLEPTRITMPILSKDDMKRGKAMQGFGILRVDLISAQNLPNADIIGLSDPMAVMMLHHEPPIVQESKCVDNTLNPQWNERFEYIVDCKEAMFSFNLYDLDVKVGGGLSKMLGGRSTTKTFLGSCELMLTDLTDNQPEERVMSLRRKDKHAGSVKFMMELKPFTDTNNPAILDPQLQSSASLAVFSVTIKYCQDLPTKAAKIRCTVGSTSFVKSVSDEKLLSTRMSFLVRHNEKFVLLVQQKSGSNELGRVEIPCSRLVNRDDRLLELFSLDAAVTGKVMLELSLRTVQHTRMPIRRHMEGLSQIGVLRCKLRGAKGLPNIERFGKSDPFAEIMIEQGGQPQTQTSTYKANNLNPEWGECFEFVISTLHDTLHFKVRDHGNNAFRDSVLGECEYDLVQLTKQANVLIHCELELAHPSKRDRTGTLSVDLEYKPFLEKNLTADAYKREADAYKLEPWSSGVAFLKITDLPHTPFTDPIFSVEGGKDAEINAGKGAEVTPSLNVPFNLLIRDFDHSLKITVCDRHVSTFKRGLAAVKGVIPALSHNPSGTSSEALFDHGSGSNRTGVCEEKFERMLTSASEPSEQHNEYKLKGLISGKIKMDMIMRTVSPDRTREESSKVSLGKARPSTISVLGGMLESAANETIPDPDKPKDSGQHPRLWRDSVVPEASFEDELKAPYFPDGSGTLTVEVVRCENLPAATTDSQANPYVSIRLLNKDDKRVIKDKTKTRNKTRSPRYGSSGGHTVFKIQDSLQNYTIEVVVKHRSTFGKQRLAWFDKPIDMFDGEPIDPSDAKALDFGVEPPSAHAGTTGQECKYRLKPSGFVYLKVISFEAEQERAKVRTGELTYMDDANTSYASSSGNSPDRGRGPAMRMREDSTTSLL